MICFDHVFKQYGKRTAALSDINTTINDGEFVFLIGPSGAGKTTLLRLLIKDLIVSKGKITVDDQDISVIKDNQIYKLRRKIGMIFQDFKLLSDRTVFENVAIGLEILGKKDIEVKKGVFDILELVHLTDKANLFPLQLSTGELQRVSIARAVAGGPKILLADEPTGNLDPETAWEILSILQEINQIGTTIIMATHNVNIVNDMKKRTITLTHGKIVSDEQKGKYHLTQNPKEHLDHQNAKVESHDGHHPKEKA
jgi:cell division transport system ATP-binding protein